MGARRRDTVFRNRRHRTDLRSVHARMPQLVITWTTAAGAVPSFVSMSTIDQYGYGRSGSILPCEVRPGSSCVSEGAQLLQVARALRGISVGDEPRPALRERRGQQYHDLDSAHDLGALIQDLVEERNRASTRFDLRPLVPHSDSRPEGVGRTNRRAELELPVKTAQECPGGARSVIDLDERAGTTRLR